MDHNTNSTSTTQSINQVVDDAMKDFDISKMQTASYDDIQQLATKFLASEDPELHAVGQELKNIDPLLFELSPSETELKALHNELLKAGKTKLQADTFGIMMLQMAVEKVTLQIVGAMNEKSQKEWENLQSYAPNIMQRLYLLDQTAQMLLGKKYDDLYEEALNSAIDLAKKLFATKQESYDLFEDMTPSQAKTAITAFDNNQYEIAVQLIFNFKDQNGK